LAERRSVTKTEMIVSELRALISNGEIARGERIQQDQLAERFRTSITPVREAIKRLEAEGLLVSEPHRVVRVSSADLEQIKGVYVSRRLLEPYAAQRAALRVSRQDMHQAQLLIERMTDPDGELPDEINRRFHFLFYDKCGIPALASLLDTLWRSYPWDILSVLDTRREHAVAEHQAMADAVTAADLDQIAKTFGDNLSRSYLAIVAHLTGVKGEDPFDLEVD
jgi:DNA-binding GntR family transcriptional regulator